MTKREQYNLIFYWNTIPGHGTWPTMSTNGNNEYANLCILQLLYYSEAEYFIDSIDLALSGQLYDPDFLNTDGTEGQDIKFEEPNFIFDHYLTIHMSDMKELLQEWVDFIKEEQQKKKRPAQYNLFSKFRVKISLLTKTFITIFAPSKTKTL
ncbi:hypothetical protein [Flavobacterium psychrotrophum]|uniref:hypothetical protein n=1 Tax=Flavobacterium psychrotrophum TaxID=2294119 RepID=UPI000E315260|nr:hypothetical protein [Flavobacterium psychrotrophum]